MKKYAILCVVFCLLMNSIAFSVISQTERKITLTSQLDSYDLAIIGPEIFSSEIQPLIEHKNNHNVETLLKTTEDIFNEYPGRDEAEQVKYYIKDAIEQWNIQYVLLVGGMKLLSFDWFVPVRYSNLDDGFGNEVFLTDLYFADVYKENSEFEDWDSNGNGVFGEWKLINGDKLDLKPDIAVGRLPCRTKNEVKNLVEKIISYENNAYGKEWFNHMVAIGSDTFPDYDGYEGESTCDIASSYMDNFIIEKLYASTGDLTGSNDLINAINSGCGFLLTRGRGGTDRIRMVMPQGSEYIVFDLASVSKLSNNEMYPICVLGECIHGRFDVGIINIIKLLQKDPEYTINDCVYECIAWRLVREKNAGAIATLTNTNICFGAFGDNNGNNISDDAELYGGFLAVELFRLYGQEKIDILGTLHQTAVSNYVDLFPVDTNKIHSKSLQEFILFGDPSLKIGGYP
jgi:hypothetical protein